MKRLPVKSFEHGIISTPPLLLQVPQAAAQTDEDREDIRRDFGPRLLNRLALAVGTSARLS